jgi:hypothetical protein
MRMIHYYGAVGALLVPLLVATVLTGIFHRPGDLHLWLGLATAILAVATNTVLILFMIVTGRVLRVAMRSRPLGPAFLEELNRFFARRSAYPLALVGAASVTATAVLGYGRFIGVPVAVHECLGVLTLLLNLAALSKGLRSLRENQRLLDRVARELDRLDRAGVEPDPLVGAPDWAYSATTRWVVFALCAWLPYLYWGLVVWRGEFGEVPRFLLVASALASCAGLVFAVRARSARRGGI